MQWKTHRYNKKSMYVPCCSNTIKLLLRRTLVLTVLLAAYPKSSYHSLNSKSSSASYSIMLSNLFLKRIKAGAEIFIL